MSRPKLDAKLGRLPPAEAIYQASLPVLQSLEYLELATSQDPDFADANDRGLLKYVAQWLPEDLTRLDGLLLDDGVEELRRVNVRCARYGGTTGRCWAELVYETARDHYLALLLGIARRKWLRCVRQRRNQPDVFEPIDFDELIDRWPNVHAELIRLDRINVAELTAEAAKEIDRWRADKTDSKTDKRKKNLPRNPKVLKLAEKIKREAHVIKEKIEIARDLCDGDEREAKSILRQLGRFPWLIE